MIGPSRTAVYASTVWLLLTTVTFFGLASIRVPKLQAIARDPAWVYGVVVSADCSNHALVYYEYTVGGQTYRAKSNWGAVCSTLGAGDKIKIYYSKMHPEASETSERHDTLAGELMMAVVASLFVSSGITLLGFLNRSRVRRLLGRKMHESGPPPSVSSRK